MERMKSRVRMTAAESAATVEVLVPETLEDKFKVLKSGEKIELLPNGIKSRQAS